MQFTHKKLLPASFSAAFAFVACGGGTSETSVSTPETQPTPSVDAASDAPVLDAMTERCDASSDLTSTIPDASILDGAANAGICLGCLKTHCPEIIDRCNRSCGCRDVVTAFLACYAIAKDIFSCGALVSGNVSPETQSIGLDVAACVGASCTSSCGLTDAGAP